MAHNWKRGLWLLFMTVGLAWLCGNCQNNQPADQAAQTGATPAKGVRLVPGPARRDAPDELYLGGVPGAPVKIEVFSDFQCPRCRDFYMQTLKPLIADYTSTGKISKIYIVYHDFPLDMHPFARKAARFALAAARIGRDRWLRVTDALYDYQAQWSLDGNIEAALSRVLEPTELVHISNLAAEAGVEAAVQNEVLFGQSRGIGSTPTFFITSQAGPEQRVAGMVTYATLRDFLDRMLN